jgi:reactive intermediate/imine deaminase
MAEQAPTGEASMVEKVVLRSEKVWDPSGAGFDHPQPFSQGIRVPAKGHLLFIAGQVALDPGGNVVGVGDARTQTRQALENLKTMVEAGGGTLDDVVRLTVFVTDMRLFPEIQEVRAEYFPDSPPASSSIEISGLVHPDLLVEIDAIAVVGD